MNFGIGYSWKAWRLLNQTPFDGCLLVFNADQLDWRIKASNWKRRHGIGFHIHAITGARKEVAHKRYIKSDLYITIAT